MIDLEGQLESLPDLVADKLKEWREATLWREAKEAVLYLKFKGEDKNRSATEIKALVNADDERFKEVMTEIKAETEYNRYYERLMSVKKIASLRVAV